MEHCSMGSCSVMYGGRQFLTKAEKTEMLQEYKEALEHELTGVNERIAELSAGS